MGKRVSGVEIHAHAISTILTGNYLSSAPSLVTLATILLLTLLCGLAVIRFQGFLGRSLSYSAGLSLLVRNFRLFSTGASYSMWYTRH